MGGSGYSEEPPSTPVKVLLLLFGIAAIEAIRYAFNPDTYGAGPWGWLLISSTALNLAIHFWLGLPSTLPKCFVSAGIDQLGMPFAAYFAFSAILRVWEVLMDIGRELFQKLPGGA